MTHQSNSSAFPPRDRAETHSLTDGLDPVPVRPRHDGWTRARQMGFIDALAACGCVAEAAGRVGISARSAYRLRARPEAASFRAAWDAALDHAVERIADAAFGRAMNGVERPIFFQGQQVGSWRQYDERLAMFILTRRAPERFGCWIDRREVRRERGDTGAALAEALARVSEDAEAIAAADARAADAVPQPVEPHDPLPGPAYYTERQADARAEEHEHIPTAEETDALIMEKLDALKRGQTLAAARIAEGRTGPEWGDAYADLRDFPDDEDWGEEDDFADDPPE
ncbi:hypothetical protein [Novosphingopyxis iocasae]|uniref:hypothetical protein n=1 Tax=Novosphingopyxis iocasae TaxID=2762729 RepID=UPI001650FE1C|nr:hypothetical protein [Novosphingopyxis iocasae]